MRAKPRHSSTNESGPRVVDIYKFLQEVRGLFHHQPRCDGHDLHAAVSGEEEAVQEVVQLHELALLTEGAGTERNNLHIFSLDKNYLADLKIFCARPPGFSFGQSFLQATIRVGQRTSSYTS